MTTKTRRIAVRGVPVELWQRMKVLSARTGRRLRDLLIDAVDRYLRTEENQE